MSIGMNLASVTYYSTEYPFLDRFKSAGEFSTLGPSGFGTPDPSVFDSNGWPTTLAANTKYAVNVALDPITNDHTNRYVINYSGTGDFSFLNANIVSRSDHQVVIEATASSILLTYTMSNSDPVHDIHVLRQDQVSLYNSGEIFNPAFTDKIGNYSDLRFMDWNQTNGSTISSWDQRTTLTDSHWNNVPIEVEVALANKVHSDMWVNIPVEADDNYVRSWSPTCATISAPG